MGIKYGERGVDRKKHDFLTTESVPRVVGTMAVPTIISMMMTSIYSIADTYFVSQLNTQSTAAVGIVFTVMMAFQAVGFLFGHGTGNYIAIRLGAGDDAEARKMAVTGIVYALSISIVLTVCGFLWLRTLCMALGCTQTVLPYAEQYMRTILLAGPFIVGSLALNVQIRQQGNAAYAMAGIMSGAVLNTLLDPLLIFTFGLGIRGAGMATLISQAVSFMILLRMTEKGGNLPLRLTNFSLNRKYVRFIMAGGTPSLTRQGLACLSALLLNVSSAAYGDTVIAAMAIITRISFLVYSVVTGLGQGFQPLCGFCYGARLYDRVMKGFWFCVVVGTAFLVLVSLTGSVFSSEIIALFSEDASVVNIGGKILRWQLLSYPLGAFIILGNMTMQSINKPVRANLLAAARRGLFFIPFLLLLPRYFGLYGLIICQPLADVFSFALSLPVLLLTFRNLR